MAAAGERESSGGVRQRGAVSYTCHRSNSCCLASHGTMECISGYSVSNSEVWRDTVREYSSLSDLVLGIYYPYTLSCCCVAQAQAGGPERARKSESSAG